MFETKEGVIKSIVYVGIVKGDRLLLVDYENAPNPSKKGWWIPAPGLVFGADPEAAAKAAAEELGIADGLPALSGVESFVLPGGWHLIYHYLVKTSSDPKVGGNFRQAKWVTAFELDGMKDIAHGKWEIGVGKRFLAKR
jgi:ADP-ribose pyrophosphatase YjhB (NUDIX family)